MERWEGRKVERKRVVGSIQLVAAATCLPEGYLRFEDSADSGLRAEDSLRSLNLRVTLIKSLTPIL